MSFLTVVSQQVPIPGSVLQKLYEDVSNIVRAATYNESYSGGRQYVVITGPATTLVSAVPGRLCRIHVPGTGGTLGNLTVYDNSAGTGSGPIMYGPTTPSTSAIIDIQMPCANGITVVSGSPTTFIVTWE